MDAISANQYAVRNEVKDLSKEFRDLKKTVLNEMEGMRALHLSSSVKAESLSMPGTPNVKIEGLSLPGTVRLIKPEHIKTEAKTSKVYTCSHCNKQLTRQTVLKNHIAKFHSDVEYAPKPKKECQYCSLKLSRTDALKRHIAIFHENKQLKPAQRLPTEKLRTKQFECFVCHNIFKTITLLKKHFSRLHSDPSISYKCEYCGKIFRSPFNLRDHSAKCKKKHKH